jgi:redox-sensitive bicupin YhaK (pirin superfamily)
VVVAPDGRDGALTIQQDATLSLANLEAGTTVSQPLAPGRNAWLQVLRGRVTLGGQPLAAGDGAGLGTEPGEPATVTVRAEEASELLLCDLA